ncbi:hypothetical protein [Carboxylicivirga linearis]|uniref:Uncharacterized protein n=1 Tax=Carboxylicivirga linearis TaxID=1628157 RepID=A0ABS5JWC5_9BACT|nr:hypothetical protein [Carboxylicivirga linearis]MBS2098651.1 hypothetical protein [Carboxylicivirga linearis]
MKRVVFIMLLVVISGSVFSQSSRKIRNYKGYRGNNIKDTLRIDYGQGQSMEITYQWFQLFTEREEFFNRVFWDPTISLFHLMEEKVEKVPLKEGVKYHITLRTVKNRKYDLENHIHGALSGNEHSVSHLTTIRDSVVTSSVMKHKRKTDQNHRLIKEKYKINDYKPDPTLSPEEQKDSMRKYVNQLIESRYTQETILSVEERKDDEQQRQYKIENGELVGQLQWQHIIELKSGYATVKLYVNDLSDLSAFNLDQLHGFLRNETANYMQNEYYKYFTYLNYKVKDGDIVYNYSPFERRRKRNKTYTFELTPVVGTSLQKSHWTADAGLQYGLTINKGLQASNRISVRYMLKSYGDPLLAGAPVKVSGFADALWDVNLAADYITPTWVGAGLGYMVHNNGNLYGDQTFRVFLKYRSSQHWGIQPEFNYSIDDKKGFVGIGLFFSL